MHRKMRSTGIIQVNQAVTQQNAALVEQATAAATSLVLQAIDLEASVSMLRLGASRDDSTEKPISQALMAAAAQR